MTDKTIHCKKLQQNILNAVKDQTAELPNEPTLAVILVGNNPASRVYVKKKMEAAQKIGINSLLIELPETASQAELTSEISKLNTAKDVNGILLQLPLPEHLDSLSAINHISPIKDVDGLTSTNVGKLEDMPDKLLPCTPLGILRILAAEKINLKGLETVVIGRSRLVGRPIANLLAHKDATVTMCHRHTKDISAHLKTADLIIIAAGHPDLVQGKDLKKGSVVIDVGINPITNSDGSQSIVGDANFKSCLEKVSRITPVPGGVGPMTVASLMTNTVDAYCLQHKRQLAVWPYSN